MEAQEDHSGSSQLAALRFVKACICVIVVIPCVLAGEPPAFMRLERDDTSVVKLVIINAIVHSLCREQVTEQSENPGERNTGKRA